MASLWLNWICVDSKQKISSCSFVDISSQSQENTNQTTKVSIFHVIRAIVFCCLMTQTLVQWRHASPKTAFNHRGVTWPSFTAEWQKCGGLYGSWWATTWRAGQKSGKWWYRRIEQKLNSPRWQTAKPYLLPENSCLPFLTFLIKFCLGIKVICRMHKWSAPHIIARLIPMTTYLRILL